MFNDFRVACLREGAALGGGGGEGSLSLSCSPSCLLAVTLFMWTRSQQANDELHAGDVMDTCLDQWPGNKFHFGHLLARSSPWCELKTSGSCGLCLCSMSPQADANIRVSLSGILEHM